MLDFSDWARVAISILILATDKPEPSNTRKKRVPLRAWQLSMNLPKSTSKAFVHSGKKNMVMCLESFNYWTFDLKESFLNVKRKLCYPIPYVHSQALKCQKRNLAFLVIACNLWNTWVTSIKSTPNQSVHSSAGLLAMVKIKITRLGMNQVDRICFMQHYSYWSIIGGKGIILCSWRTGP